MTTKRGSLPSGPLDDYRRRLVADNLALADWWMGKALPDDLPRHVREDARAAAVDGLVRAAQAFDPSRGVTFCTYALLWIRSRLGDWNRKLRRRPETCYLSELGQDVDGRCWWDPGGRLDPDQGTALDAQSCRNLLTPREWAVVWGRYGEGKTLKQIGAGLGITRERVRQVCSEVRLKLRKRLPELVEED